MRTGLNALSASAAIFAVQVLAASVPAVAADNDPTAPPGWSFRFTTYSWVSWLAGEGGVAGRTFDVKVDPIQLIEHLDWDQIPVWMSSAEARNGRLSLFNDIVYSKLEGSGEFAVSRSRRFTTLSLGGDVDAEVEQATVELGAGYAVAQWGAPGSAGFTAFDVLGGARYWHQEVDLSVDLNATLNIAGLTISRGRAVAKSGSVDWVDPFVGGRLRHELGGGQELSLRGDIGGFDVGSKLTWQAIGTYSWNFHTINGIELDGYVGYRALSVDYEQGSGLKKYEYDVIQHGPVVGMTSRF